MEFKLNDRVAVKEYKSLPKHLRNKGIAKLSGKQGTIVNKLFDPNVADFVYVIQFDEKNAPSSVLWTQDQLYILIAIPTEYKVEIEVAENVVIATLWEIKDDSKQIISKNHGHIIHEGALGVAQATSFACKRMFERVGGN